MSIGNEPELEVTVDNRQESVGEFDGGGGKEDALDHWGRRIGLSEDMVELEWMSLEVTKTRPGVQELHGRGVHEPEARRNGVERELRKSVTVTVRSDRASGVRSGCNEAEQKQMRGAGRSSYMPAKRDGESLEVLAYNRVVVQQQELP
ncbi:hypothetical protein EV363DRAFT_1298950 [Boletus edulis]|nr:hypothetical protein EV363DRAFT_1298950 [Boletus edulis]